MKLTRPTALRFVSSAFGLICSVHAQTSAPTAFPAKDAAVVLDPFNVPASAFTEGYRAQSSASGLGFSVPLDRVPIPLTVLTSQFLADSGSLRVEDAVRYVSGVTNTGRASGTENFAIRGFSTGNVLRDGEPFNTATDSALIDRVEVLKGPGAIIYGTSDPSGLVNIVQKQAHFKKETILTGTYAEDGTVHGVLDHNQPFSTTGTWRAAARLVLGWSHDGFTRPNEYRERTLASPSLHLEYGKDTVFDARANWAKETGRLNRIQTPFLNTGEGGSIFARGFVPITDDFTFVTPHDSWFQEDKGFGLRLVQHLGDNTSVLASYVQSEIDGLQYFNIGMGRIQANAAGQFVVNPARMIVEPRKTDHRGLSLKLLHTLKLGGTEHKISVGIRDNKDTNYGYAYFDSRVFANAATVIADASGPRKVSFPGAPRSVFSLNDPFATTITGVASATNPNPVPVRSAYVTDYVTLMEGRLNLLAGAHYIDIRSQNKTATSPQFGAVFELAKGYNLYALTSNSYRPNGPASTVNPALGFTDPEKGSGKEIGLKFSQFGGQLTGTLAAYKITRENIVQFLGGVFTQNNNIPSGEELSQGLELDLVYTPTPRLSIMGAYSYTDAYVSKNLITPGFDSPDENRDGIPDIIGLRKEGVAKHDIRLWLSYDCAKDSPFRGLTFGGGFTWRQGPIQQFPTYIQRFVQQVEDPMRLDLFARYATKLAGRPVHLRLNWQNATDENYRDRRGYFVQPSTLQFTAETRF
ncbi:MAG: TonB-dependent receptor plug domain-containing protein [Opitutaceae bacterium]|nr:TonB-dependent receptor plug domain-containing protein [Opitutaceae bacterium]